MKNNELYYKTHVFCCINERAEGHARGSCCRKGSVELRNYMKSKVNALGFLGVRINNSGCLDRCELGPTMVIYPEGVWYHYETKDDIDEIIEQHIKQGNIVDRLKLTKNDA